jgi:dTDP-4-dehydrorhamnose 3,5-epimerase
VILTPTAVDGAFLVELERREDERGWFARAWGEEELAAAGLVAQLSQVNLAYNERAGTLRGLHLQLPPNEDAKLVRCIRGRIQDVVADLRPASPTFRRWVGVELSDTNRLGLYIPAGCAHGYQTLADATEVLYLHSAPYRPESEGGARWDDPALAIDWPAAEPRIVSTKDRSWPDLQFEP